jgi:AAA15 family ATPase/GTPase
MITQLKIERFKSVRQLSIDCRRVNLFIGEPNTGKSNILEALGLVSWCAFPSRKLKEFVRFQLMQNLFYDNLTDEPILITLRGTPEAEVRIKFERDEFQFFIKATGYSAPEPFDTLPFASLNYQGEGNLRYHHTATDAIKFYRFTGLERFDYNDPGALLPPDGRNLFSVVYGSKAMREWVGELFRPYGLAVVMKPHERTIELQKQQDGVVTAYSYAMASDTLQRMLFYHAAMQSNKDAVLIFEEPEAHAFPFNTKHLGERIALDATNQYFIATHNLYLLTAILEKATPNDVAVFGARYRNFETEVLPLSQDQLSRLLEADPFLGLESVLGEA